MYYPVPEISFKDGLWLTLTMILKIKEVNTKNKLRKSASYFGYPKILSKKPHIFAVFLNYAIIQIRQYRD